MRLYLRGWRILARVTGMAQGATQFCRQSAFEQVGGYDEGAWIGEDVDFYWSLKKLAKRTKRTARFIRNTRVRPSSRRFDKWPIWNIPDLDNPALHRIVPPTEENLDRLVFTGGEVDGSRYWSVEPGQSGPDGSGLGASDNCKRSAGKSRYKTGQSLDPKVGVPGDFP